MNIVKDFILAEECLTIVGVSGMDKEQVVSYLNKIVSEEVNSTCKFYIDLDRLNKRRIIQENLCLLSYEDSFRKFCGTLMDDSKILTLEGIKHIAVWYSEKSVKANLITPDYGYDLISEILMAPAIASVGEAENRFLALLIEDVLERVRDISPSFKDYTIQLLRMAFRIMCNRVGTGDASEVYPYAVLLDILRDMTFALGDGIHADPRIMSALCAQDLPINLFSNVVGSGDIVRLPLRDTLINIAEYISWMQEQLVSIGAQSLWRNPKVRYIYNTDKLSLETTNFLVKLYALYNCHTHILVLPEEWENIYIRDYFNYEFAREQSFIIESQNQRKVEPIIPTDILFKIRTELMTKYYAATGWNIIYLDIEENDEITKFLLQIKKEETDLDPDNTDC